MRELLPHFERELAFLNTHAREFAAEYPRIAGRLSTSGDLLADPHVQRLVQSFALLSARIHKRLDDDFPLLTESLLEVLYPHYLRPFPSCSVAVFDLRGAVSQMSRSATVPRGTVLSSRPVRGVPCRFTTSQDVHLVPVAVVEAGWSPLFRAPEGTPLPSGATSCFHVTLELTSPQAGWAALEREALRVYLDGDASLVVALREALAAHVTGSLLQLSPVAPWVDVPGGRPRPAGFAVDEALLEADARTQPAYRLLTEFFAFPEKFHFLDLPLPPQLAATSARRVTLHYPMSGVAHGGDTARLLDAVDATHLVLHATPVVNRFRQRAEPIRIGSAETTYPLLPDARRAFGYEVLSVERVFRVQQTNDGESTQPFRPFYSLQHDDLLAEGDSAGRYWYLRRDNLVPGRSPGFETEIGIVDLDFDPARPQTDTLSIDVIATNRDLPHALSGGQPGGDLFMEGGGPVREIRLARKPTRSLRFERGQGALWRLISHLSLNHLSISEGGIDAFKEMLRLYDLPRSPATRRLLDGMFDVRNQPATAWLAGNPYAGVVRGTEVQLVVDEQAFVGIGLHLFADVMSHFLGLYAHINSFVQVKLVSWRTQEVLHTGERWSGTGPLV